jgi:hypothetical protein
MTQDKTNQSKGNAQGGQAANQGKQGDPSDWNTQKTGQAGGQKGSQPTGQQGRQKGGFQMGGKNPPTGGPDQYKPDQPMEGDKTQSQSGGNVGKGQGSFGGQQRQQGSQGDSASNPYPPTNPDRPVMAGGEGKAIGGQGNASGGSFKGGQQGGNLGSQGNIGGQGNVGAQGKLGQAGGLEEEEE